MGIIQKHVAATVGTSANDKKAEKARKLFDELMERLGNVVDAIGGDNGFKTLAVVEQLETFVDALETQGIPDNNSTNVVASNGTVSGALPTASSNAVVLGTDLLSVFGGNLTRAQLAVEFINSIMAAGPDTLDYFNVVLDDLNRDKHPDQVVIDNKIPTLRSVQTLRERKGEYESAVYDLLRVIHGGSFATGTVQEMVDNAKRALAARRTVAPTPLPAPAPASTKGDDHYIHLLGIASGISEGSITDFGRYAQYVVNELGLTVTGANAALDAIGAKLSTRRTSSDNDAYGQHLVKIIETRLADLAKAENDLKNKDITLNQKVGEFNDLKKKFDDLTKKSNDLTKKSNDTRARIVKIADKNDISYPTGATPEKIVEEMIDQKGDRFNKLSL